MIKLCCEVFWINNSLKQSCLYICLEDTRDKFSKSMHNYTFYINSSVPLDLRKCAYLKQLFLSSETAALTWTCSIGGCCTFMFIVTINEGPIQCVKDGGRKPEVGLDTE